MRLSVRKFFIVVVALAVGLSFSACTGATEPKPTPSSSVPADPALKTNYPTDFTAETAGTETVRVADAIVALIPADTVVHVDNTAKAVAATATAKAYYGVLRNITIDPGVNPIVVAKAIATKLVASGWSELHSSTISGVQVIDLASGSKAASSWFLELSGDPRVIGQSVVQLQLASPDLP